MMEKGTFVGFTAKGNRKIGLVEGPEGKAHLKVVDANSIAFTVHPREIFFSSEDFKNESKGFSPSRLTPFLGEVEKLHKQVNLEEVWELLNGEKAYTTLKEVTELLFSEATLESLYCVFIALEEDKIYFKQKLNNWELRSVDLVTDAKKQVLASKTKTLALEGLKDRLEKKIHGTHDDLTTEDRKKLEPLKKLAVWDDQAPEKNAAFELLALLGKPKTAAAALGLLVDLGVWNRHENLEIHLNQVSREFQKELNDQAELIAQTSLWPKGIFDALDQNIFTVDEASTTEIDDGFAVVWTNQEKPEIWIHIADPARYLTQGSDLDLEARRRGTSIYLPDERVTMLPVSLAEGPLSLREGVETTSLGFKILLAENGEIESFSIQRCRIKPRTRLTYEKAEALLKSGENKDWSHLETISRLRKAWRESQGAIEIRMPETDLKVLNQGQEISISVFPEYYSREIVTEMMVLAGEAAGQFCSQNQLPVAYRVQTLTNPPKTETLAAIPDGPLREFAKVSSMSRSGFSAQVGPHDGLGLKAYVQATSPIRRYLDLWAHYQILAFLETGSGLNTAEDLGVLLPTQEEAQTMSTKMERSRTKYWATEYFSRQPKNTQWKGLVLELNRRDESTASVLMGENGLRVNVKLVRQTGPGEDITFKLITADSRKEILNFIQI